MGGFTTKKTGSYKGKSNKLGHGGRAAQLAAHGVPKAVIGMIARSKGAAPGGPNYHGVRRAHGGVVKSYMADDFKVKNGLRHCADGGTVHGPGGPREDKIPAMLSDGEYVLPAKTVEAMGGAKRLDMLVQTTNDGIPPGGGLRMAKGGLADLWERTKGVASDAFGMFKKDVAPMAQRAATAAAPYVEQAAQGLRNAGASVSGAAANVANAAGADVMPETPRPVPNPTAATQADFEAAQRQAASRAVNAPNGVRNIGGVPPASSAEDAAIRQQILREQAQARGVGTGTTSATPRPAITQFGPGAAAETAAAPKAGLLRRGVNALGKVPLLKTAGVVGTGVTALNAGINTAETDIDKYAESLGIDGGVQNPLARGALRGLRFVQNIGNELGNAVGANLDRNQAQYNPYAAAEAAAANPRPQPGAAAPTSSAAPAADAGVRRALVDMGVDDPSRPPVPQGNRGEILREARPDPGAYVNLGNYGGNADVYGTSSVRGGRINRFAAAAPGDGAGYDLRRNIDSLAATNAIRQSTLDAGPAGNGVSQGVTIGDTDAFGQDAATRDAGMRAFREGIESQRGGFVPSGIRQLQLSRANNNAEFDRARLSAETARRGQDLDFASSQQRNLLTARGQDLSYDQGLRSNAVTMRGQDLDFGAKQQQVQLQIAQMQRQIGKENMEALSAELKDRVGLTTKEGNTPENMARFTAARDRILYTSSQLGINPMNLPANVRSQFFILADRAEQGDIDNQTLLRWLSSKVGLNDDRSTSYDLRDYRAKGIKRGTFSDTVKTNTGDRSVDEIAYGRDSNIIGYVGPKGLRQRQSTETLAPYYDEERRRYEGR